MEANPKTGERPSLFRRTASLFVALGAVAILLVIPPAYRWLLAWFFAISVAIGVVVAGILYLWNKYKPIKEEDIDHKRPLGL